MNTNCEHQVWALSMSTKHEHSVSFEWASLINGQLWPYGIHFPNGFFLSGYVVMTEQSLTWRHVMRCDATFGVALMWKYANKNQVINTHTHQKNICMPEWQKSIVKEKCIENIHTGSPHFVLFGFFLKARTRWNSHKVKQIWFFFIH